MDATLKKVSNRCYLFRFPKSLLWITT